MLHAGVKFDSIKSRLDNLPLIQLRYMQHRRRIKVFNEVCSTQPKEHERRNTAGKNKKSLVIRGIRSSGKVGASKKNRADQKASPYSLQQNYPI